MGERRLYFEFICWLLNIYINSDISFAYTICNKRHKNNIYDIWNLFTCMYAHAYSKQGIYPQGADTMNAIAHISIDIYIYACACMHIHHCTRPPF